MYDAFSSEYDRFVNWGSRLDYEMPFLLTQLQKSGSRHILDTATGTGMHVIELRKRGYHADGCDFSQGMISVAKANASREGVDAMFRVAKFGEISSAFKAEPPYDALLCLGNSLPHLLNMEEIGKALKDFADCLKPGGLLLIQNRNFTPVMAHQQRWMEPQSHREGSNEWVFLRFYDFDQNGLINFNVVTLKREGENGWSQNIENTWLYPLLDEELI